ncbi:DUF2971 domain-containing protein [Williamsia sp. M5A3_1d]
MSTRPELPKVLYHYTDTAGLLGILGHPANFPGTDAGVFATETGATFGTLWATDARYLNDAAELTFGAEMLAQKLENRAESTPPGTVHDRLVSLTADVRTGRFEFTIGSAPEQRHPHVTCFCTSGNLLSQWRGYGDGGGGYAIGFSDTALNEFITIDSHFFETSPEFAVSPIGPPEKVYYGDDDASQFLDDCADEIAEGVEGIETGDNDYTYPDVFHGVAARWLAQVKHDAFSEEAEWRLIVDRINKAQDSEFRPGSIGLVPYQKLHFPITRSGEPSIVKIVVGPGRERELRKEAVTHLLEKIGSTDTEVSLSDAPYRG